MPERFDIASPAIDTSLLVDIGALFSSRLRIEEIIEHLLRIVATRLECESAYFTFERDQALARATRCLAANAERQALLDARLRNFVPDMLNTLAGRTVLAGEPYFAPDLRGDGRDVNPLWRELGVCSMLVLPIAHGSETVGLLAAMRVVGQPAFSAQERDWLQAFVRQAAGAIVNARTLAEERWQRQKAELMFQASRAVHAELHFDQAMREIALLLKQSIKAPWIGLLEYQPAAHALQLLGSTAEAAVDLRLVSQRMVLDVSPEAAAALADAEPVRIPLPEPLGSAVGHTGASAWALPLLHKQQPMGLLLVCMGAPDAPLPPEAYEVAVGMAEFVALAIANQHLVDQEAKARIQVIRSQAAAQEREVLLRQVVHDLRNATQAMSLVVEDMEFELGDSPRLQTSLSTLNNQIAFISNFLKEKLNWIQPGERPQEHHTPLPAVFTSLEGRFDPSVRAKRQRLVVTPPEPVEVHLSVVQLEQALGNLLDNAIKYTPDGGEVRLWADVSDGWVTIYVADTGPGIPPADQPHIGELGYRGQQAQEGNGLGLANVRQLITRAGGLFGFSSHESVGTTFYVSLPTTQWGRVSA